MLNVTPWEPGRATGGARYAQSGSGNGRPGVGGVGAWERKVAGFGCRSNGWNYLYESQTVE